MNKEIELYAKHNYIIFSLGIDYENGKKILSFPKNWPSFTKSNIDKTKNGLAMETGKKNNIIVIDIDKIDDWNTFLINNGKEDLGDVPITQTGKGLHYYFKYSDDLEHIKSKTNCFGKEYAIDIRTNGSGNIYVSKVLFYHLLHIIMVHLNIYGKIVYLNANQKKCLNG